MSSLLFEFKNKKYKNIFGILNSPKETNPIKLILDSPKKYNSLQKKLFETKKFPKIFQIEKNRNYIDNNINLNSKTIDKQDEYQNLRYNPNSNKKNNKKISKDILNEINSDDNEIFSHKYMNTAKSKFFNNNYNKCTPSKLNNDRKFIGGSPFSPLVYHSIDIIKNNPTNKKLFIKIVKKKENDIKQLLNKNFEDTGDNFIIKKDVKISPISFNNRNEEKLKGNYSARKLSYEDFLNDLKNKNNYNLKKDLINEIYTDKIKKNKRKSVIEETYKELNKKTNNLYIQMELRKDKENEKKDIKELILDNKENNEIYNDKIGQIKKFFLKNIPLQINNCDNNQKTNEENDLYYIKYKNKKKYENENREYRSDDRLNEYYVKKCNVVLEYAYKEERNFSHKINMEDKGRSILNFNNDPNKLLFCLFDGHGGDEVSSYLQKNFGKIMKKYIYEIENEEINFEKLFEEIDEEFKNCKYYKMGSTATIVYITQEIVNNKKKLYCINIGDTRCILTHTTGSRKLSYDDLVDDEKEYNRIINEGGYIKNGRVNGQLMISRAFGDWEYKSYGVICTPHVTKIDITDKCKYIIMASDGIWDVLDDLDVYKLSLIAENSENLCNDIIQDALDKDSTDNLSCFAIKLND